ncbi:CMTR1 isoform 6, partial [Pongo abelii]
GSEQKFLIGLGKSQIYTWDGRQSDRWIKLDLKTELPRDTLLSVEIVHELKGEGKAQRKISAIHILDVLVLNGTDVREQHFNQRSDLGPRVGRVGVGQGSLGGQWPPKVWPLI